MRSSPVQRHFQKRPSSQPMPAAINTDASGLCRTNCSQAQRAAVDFVAPLLTVFRSFFAHPPELLLGSIPYGSAHFLQVFSYFFRLFAKLITCGRHVFSSSVTKPEIARRGATSEDCLQ